MHGILFAELRRFAEARMGAGAWQGLVEEAGLGHRVHLVARQFPDEEFHALVRATAGRTGKSASEVLEELGEFTAPELVKMHAHSIDAGWRTLDLVEHTEEAIHRVVRASGIDAHPPRIACRRLGESELVVEYASARRLCALAKGILRGVAAHYGETIAIEEDSCMMDGADCCRISVRVAASGRQPAP